MRTAMWGKESKSVLGVFTTYRTWHPEGPSVSAICILIDPD